MKFWTSQEFPACVNKAFLPFLPHPNCPQSKFEEQASQGAWTWALSTSQVTYSHSHMLKTPKKICFFPGWPACECKQQGFAYLFPYMHFWEFHKLIPKNSVCQRKVKEYLGACWKNQWRIWYLLSHMHLPKRNPGIWNRFVWMCVMRSIHTCSEFLNFTKYFRVSCMRECRKSFAYKLNSGFYRLTPSTAVFTHALLENTYQILWVGGGKSG